MMDPRAYAHRSGVSVFARLPELPPRGVRQRIAKILQKSGRKIDIEGSSHPSIVASV